MVDKNLFLHNMAVVAIMKDEEHYVKEWLDYHLLAGADHFYIYDNDSTPEFKKILQPYIDANIVTYIYYPGKARQYEAYNDAFKRFRFDCRYMAFLDSDEFIFPKSKPTISEVYDEVLGGIPTAAALGVNWRFFGSNNLEKADYTQGILDRFTARDATVNKHIKSILNPRRVKFFLNPHFAIYYDGCYSVNEKGQPFIGPFNEVKTTDKIAVHHYYTKSLEEFEQKITLAKQANYKRDMASFKIHDRNDEFDDGIVKYRDARQAETGGGGDSLCRQAN